MSVSFIQRRLMSVFGENDIFNENVRPKSWN